MVETVNVNPNNKNIYNDIPLTKDESVLMEGLKSMIKKENLTYNKDKIDENYLIRFLRARKLKLDKALDMFKKYLIFRQENSYIENIENTTIPEEADILTYLPQGYHKTDKFDRPIYYELLGRLNLDKLLQITTLDNLFKHRIKVLENMISNILPAASLSAKRNIHQYFSIIDLKGFSSKFLSKKFYEYIKSTLTATQNYYPEILGQMYIVNSNLVFKGAWAIIKPFLDEKTKSKIIFSGKDYKKRLLENITDDNIPSFLEGKCMCTPNGCLYSNAGPWNTDNLNNVNIPVDKLPTDEGLYNDEDNNTDPVIGS